VTIKTIEKARQAPVKINNSNENHESMSEKYKFRNPFGIYFITPTITGWIDLFIIRKITAIVQL